MFGRTIKTHKSPSRSSHQVRIPAHLLSTPLKKAFVIQSISTLVTVALGMMLPKDITLLHACIIQGTIAALLSFHPFRMAYWWAIIHLAFFPATLGALALGLPAYSHLAMLIILALTFGRTDQTQVPLFLSSKETIQALAQILPTDRNFSFLDLGSGCGGLVCKLTRILHNGNFHGIEMALLPFWISRLRNNLLGHRCQFSWKNIWQHNLSKYDVVYAYLSPVPMPSLWEKARREMRQGSLLISNTFVIPNVPPDRSIRSKNSASSILYVWEIN